MTTREVVQAVEAWVISILPTFQSFDYPPEELTGVLPLVMAAVDGDGNQDASDQLPGQAQFEQTFIRVRPVTVVLLVAPDPARDATHSLYDAVDALGGSLHSGVALGGNVVLSQYYEADYNPPEIEYQDGTIARQVTINVTVGETIAA